MINKTGVLQFLELELGIKSTDDLYPLIESYVDRAYDDIKDFCNNEFLDEDGLDIFPNKLNRVVEELVILRYRMRGTEGKVNENIGDYSYQKAGGVEGMDIPKHLRRKLYKYRKVRII